jgi:hypothetical protein
MIPQNRFLRKPVPRQLPPDPMDVLIGRLGIYSRLGNTFVAIWFVGNRPFCRHLFVALYAMAFATLMLPAEMMFFVRHPALAVAVPLATGFVAANLGRSVIGTLAAWTVLPVLAVAAYRSADADPVTGPWLRSRACRNTSVKRTTGMDPLAIISASTWPGPTEGN